MYQKFMDDVLSHRPMKIFLYFLIPLSMYAVSAILYYVDVSRFNKYNIIFVHIMVTFTLLLMTLWHFHLGRAIQDLTSKITKEQTFFYIVRNMILVGVLAVVNIWQAAYTIINPFVLRGEEVGFTSNFFYIALWGLTGLCFINFAINASGMADILARIIKPKMRNVYFFMLLFFPIGLWYIQPKLSRIKTKKVSAKN